MTWLLWTWAIVATLDAAMQRLLISKQRDLIAADDVLIQRLTGTVGSQAALLSAYRNDGKAQS